jgi:hypothetical protein
MKLNLEDLLNPTTFVPFVLTIADGTAIPVTDPRKTLVYGKMVIVGGPDKRLYHIPFRAIAHITIAGQEVG